VKSGKALRSRLYDCAVTHSRSLPVENRFEYRYFTFCLDLDEIDEIASRSRLLGRGVLSAFRFCGEDFIFGRSGSTPAELKERVIEYARHKGVTDTIERVELVGHLRTFGHSFNPAAFYYCYDSADSAVCAVLEVTNTYREKKSYLITGWSSDKKVFSGSQTKNFYVSPFVQLDAEFHFSLEIPRERLSIRIDSMKGDEVHVRTYLAGEVRALTDARLLTSLLRYPWVTVGVVIKIHYQALRLYLKRVPFIRKNKQTELQQGGQS
jgi:DUF1365 family protein